MIGKHLNTTKLHSHSKKKVQLVSNGQMASLVPAPLALLNTQVASGTAFRHRLLILLRIIFTPHFDASFITGVADAPVPDLGGRYLHFGCHQCDTCTTAVHCGIVPLRFIVRRLSDGLPLSWWNDENAHPSATGILFATSQCSSASVPGQLVLSWWHHGSDPVWTWLTIPRRPRLMSCSKRY